MRLNRQQIKIADRNIASLSEKLDKARQTNVGLKTPIFNAALYIAIILRDVHSFADQILLARSLWERRLCARHLAILLYEAGDDIPDLLGQKQFRSVMNQLHEWPEIERNLNKASKIFRISYDKHRRYLKRIRNNASAHHDQDSKILKETILEIDPPRILVISHDMLLGFNELLSVILFCGKKIEQSKNFSE